MFYVVPKTEHNYYVIPLIKDHGKYKLLWDQTYGIKINYIRKANSCNSLMMLSDTWLELQIRLQICEKKFLKLFKLKKIF